MIVLIDTQDNVIEAEGVKDEKETKKILRDALTNFKDYEHIIVEPPPKLHIYVFNPKDIIQHFPLATRYVEKPSDVKPGPTTK